MPPTSAAMRLPRAGPTAAPRLRALAAMLPPSRARAAGAAAVPPHAPTTPTRAPALLLGHRRRRPTTTTTKTTVSAATLEQEAPTTTTETPTPFYAGKRAVVVGAGPAGSTAAIFLARLGFQVDVYDRRPEPRDDAVDAGRAYVIIAIPRGRKVLDQLRVALGPEAEQALMLGGGGGGEKKKKSGGDAPPPRAGTVRHAADGKVTSSREDGNVQLSRSALAQALIDAAKEQWGGEGGGASSSSPSGPGSIAFHFNWSAEGGVDLKRRRVTFTRTNDGEGGGGKDNNGSNWAVAPFDLLVGADGAGSAVRAAFASEQSTDDASLPPFTFDVEDTGREYKTYASAPGGADFSEPEGLEGAATLHLWRPKKADKTKRWDRFASFTTHSNPDGTYSGTIALRKGGFEALEAKAAAAAAQGGGDGGGDTKVAAYESFLRDAFVGVPERWIPQIAKQLAASKPRSAGRRVRCSRLYDGGRAVLIGDAAHGVSPVFGQGMNSSLETASVLARVLKECAEEASGNNNAIDAALDAAPRRFDAERREDAHALVTLDRKAFSFFGAGPVWDAFQLLAHVIVGSVLGKLLPWLYGRRKPALLSLGSPDTSYGAILREVRRDAAALATGLLALAAWLGSKAWAAKGEAVRRAVFGA